MRSRQRRAPRKGDLRHVLAVRPGLFAEWSQAFINACGHIMNGEYSHARELLIAVDGRAISIWYDYTAQNAGRDRAVLLKPFRHSQEEKSSGQSLDRHRMPGDEDVRTLFLRDRNRCRYCHQAVVTAEVLQVVSAKTGVNLLKSSTNLQTHGLYWLHCASIDHVFPHARGGFSDEHNLVVSCNTCQFGKGAYTLEEVGLELRPPAPELQTEFGVWSNIIRNLATTPDA